MNRYRGVILRVTGIIAVLIAIIVGVRYVISAGPNEKYRVAHPAGYSVIRPSDWTANIVKLTDSNGFRDSILLSPDQWIGQQPTMWVKRYAAPPELAKLQSLGFTAGTFQGQSAWISEKQPKVHLIRTVVFQRGDDWFNAGVALPGLEGAKMGDWWRYIESFQPRAFNVTIDPARGAATSAPG